MQVLILNRNSFEKCSSVALQVRLVMKRLKNFIQNGDSLSIVSLCVTQQLSVRAVLVSLAIRNNLK